jgi:hypothetical protein
MKAFVMILFLCLFMSLSCKSGRQVLNCLLSKLSDDQCKSIVNNYKNGSISTYVKNNKSTLTSKLNQCL